VQLHVIGFLSIISSATCGGVAHNRPRGAPQQKADMVATYYMLWLNVVATGATEGGVQGTLHYTLSVAQAVTLLGVIFNIRQLQAIDRRLRNGGE
jgi:hypothetical protein